MSQADRYIDLDGNEISLESLDADERKLVTTLRSRAATEPAWHEFGNFWMKRVGDFYKARGMSRKRITATPVWRIAEDLDGRLAVAQGVARVPDYRDAIEDIILTKFKSRRAFCKKTRLSEAMLSHVLAGRKHLAIDTLIKALKRIGYRLRIVPDHIDKQSAAGKRAAG